MLQEHACAVCLRPACEAAWRYTTPEHHSQATVHLNHSSTLLHRRQTKALCHCYAGPAAAQHPACKVVNISETTAQHTLPTCKALLRYTLQPLAPASSTPSTPRKRYDKNLKANSKHKLQMLCSCQASALLLSTACAVLCCWLVPLRLLRGLVPVVGLAAGVFGHGPALRQVGIWRFCSTTKRTSTATASAAAPQQQSRCSSRPALNNKHAATHTKPTAVAAVMQMLVAARVELGVGPLLDIPSFAGCT